MSLLASTAARFKNTSAQKLHVVKVNDPLHGVFMQACSDILRIVNTHETDHITLRIKVSGLLYRVSSFIGDDYSSQAFFQHIENELHELIAFASQFESVEKQALKISETLKLMIERGVNLKRQAVEAYLCREALDITVNLVVRGHNWRSLELPFQPFMGVTFDTLSIDAQALMPLETVAIPMSPHLLARKLQKEILYGGLARKLVVFLFDREKLRFPKIPIFVASDDSLDCPLIPAPVITVENFSRDEHPTETEGSIELELDPEDQLVTAQRVLRILLISNEEIILRPWDMVWCGQQGHLVHLPAVELEEGARLLLRSEHQLEKPEEYLDRSEVWRTPLRNLINLGISCDLISRNIEHRAAVTVNARMVRSWIDGSILGPEDKTVFFQMIEELKLRQHVDKWLSEGAVNSWWEDLEKARLSQTSLGIRNRSDTLKDAQKALETDSEWRADNSSLYEFSEILVIDRVLVDGSRDVLTGISNHRNMRVFS